MSSYSSKVLKVLGGSAFAQAIGLAVLPLLSRLYEPAAFGSFQVLASLLTVSLIASSLRIEIGVLSADDNELPALVTCAFWLSGITSAMVLVGVIAWLILSEGSLRALELVALALPVMALLAGWSQVLTYLALRDQHFGLTATSKVVQAAGTASFAVGFGALALGALGLALADVAGRAMQVGSLWARLRHRMRWSWRFSTSVLFHVLDRQRDLWRISLPAALVNTVASAYPPILMLTIFDAHAAGSYALAERILVTPVALIVGASSQVFMTEFARCEPASRQALLRKVVLNQLQMGILPALALAVLAPPLLPFVLGGAWKDTGVFAQALVPVIFASFAIGPVNMALTVAGMQGRQLYWDLARLLGAVGTWTVIAQQGWSPANAVWLHSLVAAVFIFSYFLLADRALRVTAVAPKMDR